MSESKKHAAIAAVVLSLSLVLGIMLNPIAGAIAHVMLIIVWISAHVLAGNLKEILQEDREKERDNEVRLEAELKRLGLEKAYPRIRRKSSLGKNIKRLDKLQLTAIILLIVHTLVLAAAWFFPGWVWTYSPFAFVPEFCALAIQIVITWRNYDVPAPPPPPNTGMSSGIVMEPLEPFDNGE
jgi:hypothetical protein